MKDNNHLRTGGEALSSFRIGQVAAKTGLNPKTIRYYEEIGLVPSPERTEVISGNGYRLYSSRDVGRLQLVKRVRTLGMPLKEVKKLVRTAERGCCPTVDPKLSKLLKTQVSEIEQKIKELTELKVVLSNLSKFSSQEKEKVMLTTQMTRVGKRQEASQTHSRALVQNKRGSETCSSLGCLCSSEKTISSGDWQKVHFKLTQNSFKKEKSRSQGCCEPNCSPETCP